MQLTIKQYFNSFRDKLFAEITTIPELLQNARFPSLNGIRGIAIIIVVMAHLRLSDNDLYHIIFNGELGVDFFFVLPQ